MNYSRSIFLISDDVRAVNVTYEDEEAAPRTMFKTFNPEIKVDDYVVVPTDTRHRMTVCKVVDVDVEPDLESASDMKWIVGIVDRADFESIRQQEEEAITKIKGAEKRRKRAELREALLADAEDEIKSLPIYTARAEEKK